MSHWTLLCSRKYPIKNSFAVVLKLFDFYITHFRIYSLTTNQKMQSWISFEKTRAFISTIGFLFLHGPEWLEHSYFRPNDFIPIFKALMDSSQLYESLSKKVHILQRYSPLDHVSLPWGQRPKHPTIGMGFLKAAVGEGWCRRRLMSEKGAADFMPTIYSLRIYNLLDSWFQLCFANTSSALTTDAYLHNHFNHEGTMDATATSRFEVTLPAEARTLLRLFDQCCIFMLFLLGSVV